MVWGTITYIYIYMRGTWRGGGGTSNMSQPLACTPAGGFASEASVPYPVIAEPHALLCNGCARAAAEPSTRPIPAPSADGGMCARADAARSISACVGAPHSPTSSPAPVTGSATVAHGPCCDLPAPAASASAAAPPALPVDSCALARRRLRSDENPRLTAANGRAGGGDGGACAAATLALCVLRAVDASDSSESLSSSRSAAAPAPLAFEETVRHLVTRTASLGVWRKSAMLMQHRATDSSFCTTGAHEGPRTSSPHH